MISDHDPASVLPRRAVAWPGGLVLALTSATVVTATFTGLLPSAAPGAPVNEQQRAVREPGVITHRTDAAARVATTQAQAGLDDLAVWGAMSPDVAGGPTLQAAGDAGGLPSLQLTKSSARRPRVRLGVERRLARLGYPTGRADGTYTVTTRRAMCAWRETHGLPPGRYGVRLADVVSVLEARALPPASRPQGLYVNRRCQVLYQVRDGAYRRIAPVSTGQVPAYDTPAGSGRVWRKWPGWHGSSLYPGAQMLNSIYFRRDRPGIALHGSISDSLVEPYPASHGCVRVPQAVITRIFAETRHGTLVRVYGAY